MLRNLLKNYTTNIRSYVYLNKLVKNKNLDNNYLSMIISPQDRRLMDIFNHYKISQDFKEINTDEKKVQIFKIRKRYGKTNKEKQFDSVISNLTDLIQSGKWAIDYLNKSYNLIDDLKEMNKFVNFRSDGEYSELLKNYINYVSL